MCLALCHSWKPVSLQVKQGRSSSSVELNVYTPLTSSEPAPETTTTSAVAIFCATSEGGDAVGGAGGRGTVQYYLKRTLIGTQVSTSSRTVRCRQWCRFIRLRGGAHDLFRFIRLRGAQPHDVPSCFPASSPACLRQLNSHSRRASDDILMTVEPTNLQHTCNLRKKSSHGVSHSGGNVVL